MTAKNTLFGLIASLVLAGAAHAETPHFDRLRSSGGPGANADRTAITFGELSAVGATRFSFSQLPEQTVYRSKLAPSSYATAPEDDFRSRSRLGDVDNMVVNVDIAPVAEPETCALMLAGLVAFFFVARRRRRD